MPSANRKAPHMTSPLQKTTRFIPISSQNTTNQPKIPLQQILQRGPTSSLQDQVKNGNENQGNPSQNGQKPSGYGIRVAYNTGSIMDPIKIDDILRQVDPSTQLENDVKEALLEFVNDYVDKILEKSCEFAKHRGSKKVDPKDVAFVIKRLQQP